MPVSYETLTPVFTILRHVRKCIRSDLIVTAGCGLAAREVTLFSKRGLADRPQETCVKVKLFQ